MTHIIITHYMKETSRKASNPNFSLDPYLFTDRWMPRKREEPVGRFISKIDMKAPIFALEEKE